VHEPHLAAGVPVLAHLLLPVEVRVQDVRCVQVRGQHGAQEEHAVDEQVRAGAAEEEDGERGEEHVDEPQGGALDDHGLLRWVVCRWGVRILVPLRGVKCV
jgi:hypothetical protein